jgi:ATP-binding cassette subfamily B (MDR/TAP) protein 1
VQAALDAASEGRTTITIAHRLSTIRNADNIVVMQDGCIVEQGTHNYLLNISGAYSKLVAAQSIMESSNGSSSHSSRMDEKEDDKIALDTEVNQEDDAFAGTRSRSTKEVGHSHQEHSIKREERYSLWILIKLILSFNAPEWKLMAAGFLFSIICGGGNSMAAVFFAKQISILSRPTPPADPHDVKQDSDFWSGMYVMLAFVLSSAYCGQGIAFAKCSERLIHRVRDRAFRTMLRQDIAYFDRDENTAGALTSFLSTETTHLAGLSGVTLGNLLNVCTTLIVACALSLAIGWELALVCIATMPILIACGFFHFWMLSRFQRHSKAAYSASASFASEAVSAIRTVASLTREDDVLKEYHDSLVAQQRRSLVSISRSTVLYAASQSLIFFCFALGFWYGGTLLGKHKYDLFQFFLCFMAIIFGAQSAGFIFSSAPDMGKAHSAASELKSLFDRRPSIDTWAENGRSLEQLNGSIELRDVHFRYPTRPDQPVLNGLNLHIHPGQYVALVGASGCGKSTAIALLERFYDPLLGSIFVDGIDIKTLNVNNYRTFIALVSQEPTLYQGTIRENIVLGSLEAGVTDEVLNSACRDANVYEFIMSLPDGFNTVVGSKGGLLSGGQKQRIAIARALVRNPRILLLDEATSALDSGSEHVVQAALDKAAKGRTTIAVAHRLSTIQNADAIYVFDQGRVVEAGTHAELIGKNGRYAELARLQSLIRG